MADAPKAGAGWYPDPELVDTVRYWDGGGWTEHRAPAARVEALPPISTPQSSSHTDLPTAPAQGKNGRKWLGRVIAAVGVLAVIGIAVSIKVSLDNNVSQGREIADSLTVSQEEIDSVASYFASPSPAVSSRAMPDDNAKCRLPAESGGLAGRWVEVGKSGDVLILSSSCQLTVYFSDGDVYLGLWRPYGNNGDAGIMWNCNMPDCEQKFEQQGEYDFLLALKGNKLVWTDLDGSNVSRYTRVTAESNN